MSARPGLALLACLPLALAACGGNDSGGGGGGGGASAAGPNTVVMKDIKFSPATITVKQGTEITWKNEDSVPHDVANAKDGQQPKSQLFNNGGTYKWTADKPGTITYVCTIHPGMQGTIVVKP